MASGTPRIPHQSGLRQVNISVFAESRHINRSLRCFRCAPRKESACASTRQNQEKHSHNLFTAMQNKGLFDKVNPRKQRHHRRQGHNRINQGKHIGKRKLHIHKRQLSPGPDHKNQCHRNSDKQRETQDMVFLGRPRLNVEALLRFLDAKSRSGNAFRIFRFLDLSHIAAVHFAEVGSCVFRIAVQQAADSEKQQHKSADRKGDESQVNPAERR